MKFKIGDKVTIRNDLICGRTYDNCLFAPGMKQYRGKEATITNIWSSSPTRFNINLDKEYWAWCADFVGIGNPNWKKILEEI